MLDKVFNWLILTLIAASVGLYVHRNYVAPPTAAGADRGSITYREDWKKIRDVWGTAEDTTSQVQVIVFSDFECPACADFSVNTLPALRAKYNVGLTVVNFPLPMHKFSKQTARMALCAGDRFFALHDLLYAKQDSFGLKPWVSYAKDAGVVDTATWNACVADSSERVKVEGSFRLAQRLNVGSTPTLVINGWQLTDVNRTVENLSTMIDDILQGKKPVVPRN